MTIGLPPFFTRETRSVCKPIAHIAIAIKNFASHFIVATKFTV